MKAASDCGRDGGTRWRAVEAVAGEVDRLELVSGDMVDRLIRAAGARKAGHRRFDADRNFTIVGGQRLTLREGATSLR